MKANAATVYGVAQRIQKSHIPNEANGRIMAVATGLSSQIKASLHGQGFFVAAVLTISGQVRKETNRKLNVRRAFPTAIFSAILAVCQKVYAPIIFCTAGYGRGVAQTG